MSSTDTLAAECANREIKKLLEAGMILNKTQEALLFSYFADIFRAGHAQGQADANRKERINHESQ